MLGTVPLLTMLMAALIGLWVTGNTINLMTLGGLALAVGILVESGTRADGRLWLVTSNTFRGSPRPGDDRIVILPTDWYRQALR